MEPATESHTAKRLAQLIAWIDGIALPMFLVRTSPDGTILFLGGNRSLTEMAGCTAAALPGKPLAEAFPARLARSLEDKYRAALALDGPVSHDEIIQVSGQDTYWRTTLSKPVGFGGSVLLGVAVPDTDRKLREFATANKMAEIAARFDELRLFSTMAAHDARSPLATVSSLIDIIKDDFVDFGDGKMALLDLCQQTVTEALSQITATLQRAQDLTLNSQNEVLVDLSRLTADIAAMIDPSASIDIDLPDGLVFSDEVLLQMGLRNLMANAARFCDRKISVVLETCHQDGRIALLVADDGPGVPEGAAVKDLTAITRTHDKSHGFGLHAIEQLAANRGGRLEIVETTACRPLSGAAFRLILPGRVVPAEAAIKRGAAFAAE